MTQLNKSITAVVSVLALIGTNGCASDQPLERTTTARIQTIAISEFEGPPRFNLVGYSSCQGVGGPTIGRIRADSETFSAAMASQNLRLEENLTTAITQALQANGYEIIRPHIARKTKGRLIGANDVRSVQADAVFDLVIGPGVYANSLLGREFYPQAHFDVRLVDPKSGATLYSERIFYLEMVGPAPRFAHKITPDKKYTFPSCRDVLDNPAKAADGFRAAAPLVAERVKMSLAK